VAPRALTKLVLHHHLHLQGIDHLHLPIEIPSLRSLEILPLKGLTLGFEFGNIFDVIEAPNLESLVLDVAGGAELSNLISTSRNKNISVKFPRLTALGLHLGNVPESKLPELCDALPVVTRIMSTRSGDIRGLLNFLDATNGPTHWAELLSVAVPRHSYKSDLDLLCAIISSRITAGHPIGRLEVHSSITCKIPADRLQWLRDHVELDFGL
jgi:hypothetical protein